MQNQAIITGRLTKESDLESVNDHSLVRFTLATSRDYKAAVNTYPTDFIDACLWGTPAERFVSLVHKGDVVQITGRLQTRTYQDANGSHHKRTEILVDKWYHLMPKQENPRGVDRETGEVSALEDLDV